jgi:D-alanine transaminase
MAKPLHYAYLNGEYLALADAKVSVLDRGFLFGDGVYEVIPVYAGHLFEVDAHLGRLAYSLGEIGLANPLDDAEWRAVLGELVRRNGGDNQALYLQVTRGADSRRDHGFPRDVPATVFAMSSRLEPIPEARLAAGVTAITRDDSRWRRCDIKSTALLANVLLRQEAIDAEATDAILIRDGYATEGARSSLFICDGDKIYTPPQGNEVLPGITRQLVIQLARQHGLHCDETRIPEPLLRSAGEIWLTSSTREVLPVTRLDGKPVGMGSPGPHWHEIHALFQDYKRLQINHDR